MTKPTKKTAAKTVVDSKTKTERTPDWKRVVAISAAKRNREDQDHVVLASAIKPLKRLGVTPEPAVS